ncbi:hypothetical protein [Chitinibacter sp. ZOR0017]|uniref:hypothetical protein n=1 Tax=Chitinibacter sp. ZOR0017 TaxID=1339254 RepID=UPI0012E09B8E|nr:hypothetical protein [Chitinibacter sp. ZOR0017]
MSYTKTSSRWSQSSVQVAISPLNHPYEELAKAGEKPYGNYKLQRKVWLPVGVLRALKVGTVWQNGMCIHDPDYDLEVFQNIAISPETTTYVKSGASVDGDYLLPWGEHRGHQQHTHSNGICIALPDGRQIFVPCLELIRFYFGSSGSLISRLFSGALKKESLWQELKFNDQTRHLHLKLASKLPGPAAADIGRIALSQPAWRAAAYVYQSCAQSVIEHREANPFTTFPFVGKTTLQANGAWISFKGVEKSTFVVFSLQSCSYPFPFRSLSYELELSAAHTHGRVPSGDNKKNQPAKINRDTKEQARLVDGDPDKNKNIQARWMKDKAKFPDLKKKPVWLDKEQYSDSPDVYLHHEDGKFEQVASGDAVGHGGRAIDLISLADGVLGQTSEQELPRFVERGLTELLKQSLARNESATVDLIIHPAIGKKVFALPKVIDDDGVIDDITQIVMPNGRLRQKQACFAIVMVDDKNEAVFLVVESAGYYAAPNLIEVVNFEQTTLMGLVGTLLTVYTPK